MGVPSGSRRVFCSLESRLAARHYVAPTELTAFLEINCYKDLAPTMELGLSERQARSVVYQNARERPLYHEPFRNMPARQHRKRP